MAAPSVTHTFSDGTTIVHSEVNQNFTDIINGVSDGTKDLTINDLTVGGTATFNGAVTLGNATGDDITITGRVASDIDPKTAATNTLGDSTQTWRAVYLDNGATDGGAVYFNASATAFLKSDASGADLDLGGFTGLDLGANCKIKTFGTETSAKTGAYVITDTDGLGAVLCDANGGDVDVTLPTAADNTGRVITIKKTDATLNDTVTVKSDAAGETIDGVSGTTGIVLYWQYDAITVQSDGADWHILNRVKRGLPDASTVGTGQIGEILSANSTTTLAGAAWKSLTSVSVTAGVWLMSGVCEVDDGATTRTMRMSINTTSGGGGTVTSGNDTGSGGYYKEDAGGGIGSICINSVYVNISSTTTYHLNVYIGYIDGGHTASNYIQAVRIA